MHRSPEDILQWAKRQIENTLIKFSDSENTAVYFNDYDAIGINIPLPLPSAKDGNEGGILIFRKNGDKKKIVDYTMCAGALLDIHHHPDYIEIFEMTEGIMIDEITGHEYIAPVRFEILPYVPHQFRCVEDANMRITMMKV